MIITAVYIGACILSESVRAKLFYIIVALIIDFEMIKYLRERK